MTGNSFKKFLAVIAITLTTLTVSSLQAQEVQSKEVNISMTYKSNLKSTQQVLQYVISFNNEEHKNRSLPTIYQAFVEHLEENLSDYHYSLTISNNRTSATKVAAILVTVSIFGSGGGEKCGGSVPKIGGPVGPWPGPPPHWPDSQIYQAINQ